MRLSLQRLAGFLVGGLAPVSWWVVLGLVRLVVRAMLRKTLCDLSAGMGGAVFQSCWSFGLQVSWHLEPFRLLNGAKVVGRNSSLQEDSHQCMLIKTAAVSLFPE